MYIEKSSTFHTTFVQIVEFDLLSGRQKGLIFVKMFKNLLLRNHKGDEAETWHTCLGQFSFYINCVENRLIMGKVEIDSFCCLDHWRYLIFFFTDILIE